MQNIEHKNERMYKKGELLFKEGEPGEELYIVQSGKVKVYRQEKDKVFDLGSYGKGSVIGEMALFDNNPRSATAEAETDARVLYIDKDHFSKHLEKIPGWLSSIVKMIIVRLRETTKRIKDDTLDDYLISTVAWLLVFISSKNQNQKDGEASIDMHQGNKIITGILDIDLDLLSECYDILVNKKLIKIDRGHILIPSPDVLELFVEYKKGGVAGVLGEAVNEEDMFLLNSFIQYGRKYGAPKGKGFTIDLKDFKNEFEKLTGQALDMATVKLLTSRNLILMGEDDKGTMRLTIQDKQKIQEMITKYDSLKNFDQ